MSSLPINPHHIVIFSGAGISVESGLQTFRDRGGLWNNHSITEVATPLGWQKDPQRVLDFYNERRQQAAQAQPNQAHLAIAELEQQYSVTIITQNVDDLHERAGSTQVIHVHGQLNKARSTIDPELVYDIGDRPIQPGDRCDKGSQLRPHIVWFGETIQNYDNAAAAFKTAARVLVVGSSLTVYPAAQLLKKARYNAEKIIVSLEIEKKPFGYTFVRGTATEVVPRIVTCWLQNKRLT